MATTTTTKRSVLAPVERLRALADTDVTVSTHDATVTGRVLSCTRVSVWLVCDDEDVVIALDDIVAVLPLGISDAA